MTAPNFTLAPELRRRRERAPFVWSLRQAARGGTLGATRANVGALVALVGDRAARP